MAVPPECSSALSSTLTLHIDSAIPLQKSEQESHPHSHPVHSSHSSHSCETVAARRERLESSASADSSSSRHSASSSTTLAAATPSNISRSFLAPTPIFKLFQRHKHDEQLTTTTSSARASTIPPHPGAGVPTDPYIVDFLPGDTSNPYNWSTPFRWFITLIIALGALCIAFSSSSYSAAIKDVQKEFPGTSRMEGIVGISLYVLGFGFGPLIWAPISELHGRNLAFNISYPLFVLFNMAAALSPNVPALLVFRFLAGTFGSSPLTNAGGQIGDMWQAHERALAGSLFALAPFLGPVLGPIIGGFVAEYKGFRAVFWVNCGFAAAMLVLSVLFVPETYAPTLLRRRARALTEKSAREGKNMLYISKFDVVKRSRWHVVKVGMMRPFAMTVREVIVLCLGIYAAIIYGTLYLFFTAYPIVFQQHRGWSISIGGLPFLGIGVGLILGILINPLGDRYYDRALLAAKEKGDGEPVPPESRLPMCCFGAVLLPLGLFIFAWTSTPNVHWIVPILASVPFGCGYILIFTGISMYLIDSYTLYAASALASNAVLRSILGTVFPLFGVQLYTKLGIHWAGTLLACLSLACTPMPFLFYKYGPLLRKNSRYAPSSPAAANQLEHVDGERAVAATGLMATGEPDKALLEQQEQNDLEAGLKRG